MIEEPTRVVLSRQELYEKLWAVPAASLSKTFGISDVGLAKVCRKHRVPRPPRGHWAKLRNGKRVHKEPLPANDDPQLDKVVIHRMMIVESPSADQVDGRFGPFTKGRSLRPARFPTCFGPSNKRPSAIENGF